MKINFSFAPDTKVTLVTDGQTETVDLWSRAHSLLEGHAGRVNVYHGQMTDPSAGTAIVRSDGKTTLDLRGETGPVEVSVGLAQGRKGLIRVPARAQKRGHPSGEHYWLPQDPVTGRFKPEPGRRHRKVYLSGSPAAMTRAMIAAHAGVATNTVTGAWLEARPHYGGSEAMPLAADAWTLLQPALQGRSREPRSDWIRYERGYEYTFLNTGNIRGESELHPVVVEAWGTGARPIVRKIEYPGNDTGPRFILFRDLAPPAVHPQYGYCVIFENCRISAYWESQLRNMGMPTMRECAIFDVTKTAPGGGRVTWDGSNDRISGLFASFAQNMMFDGCLVDRNGWVEGYDYNRDGTMPMPPSDRNHGLYLTFDCETIFMRDNLISRNASCGLQIRFGGQYERNLFVDNNIAAAIHSGSKIGRVNQFANLIDQVNFGAGYKRVNGYEGAYRWAFDATANLTSMIGCVVAHLANPDDPAEIATRRTNSDRPDWDAEQAWSSSTDYLYNDTQRFAWNRERYTGEWVNVRVDGLDTDVLLETTIQRFAAQLLDEPVASINDLVVHLRQDTEGQIGQTVREAVTWTKARFGTPLPERATPADLIFRPDPRTDGFRWDNRLNWSTRDLPGTHGADAVDLDGHNVLFGTLDDSIGALASHGGTLDVTSGRLTVGAITDAAHVTVRNSGQFRAGATSQPLTVRTTGGRVNLTGAVPDLALEARGNAEVLLGPDATIPAGKALVLGGQRCLVGWDGTGSATLTVRGALEFRAGIALTVGGTHYKQRHFKPGNRIVTDNFEATIADYEERSSAYTSDDRLFLSDLTGMPVAGETFLYHMESHVSDTVDRYDPLYGTVTAILSRGVPILRRFRSGAVGDGLTEPTVAVSLVLAAGSAVLVDGAGLTPGSYDLTGPGVTVTNNGATLPAGVSVMGGKLVLTVS